RSEGPRMRRVKLLAPLLIVLATAWILVAVGQSAPDHLEPRLAWAGASRAHPFGCGEAGVDLLALVSHAVLPGIVLAVAVALAGFVVGTPLGAAAAMARGRFERGLVRACDLLQAFPTFLLALAVLSAVRNPDRFHLGCVFSLTAWAPFARL